MNTDPNANCRAAIERLMQEFASASSDDAPIIHQRLSGLPSQRLTRDIWNQFSLATYGRFDRKKKGEWQEWVPHPAGSVCSRFVGAGDKAALNRFRQLADTGMALLKTAAANAGTTWHFDTNIVDQVELEPTDQTFVHWLEMLHLTAKQCRTLFLHVTVGNWGYSLKPNESAEQVASAMSEPTDFGVDALPIHPVMESLQHDIFRSSVEAIKVWLGMADVGRVGDWPDRPPIYSPPLREVQQHMLENEEEPASPTPALPTPASPTPTSPTPAANVLVTDPVNGKVSYGGITRDWKDTLPFKLLHRLNNRREALVSMTSLKNDVWDRKVADETIQKQISLLRIKLKDDGFTGIAIDGTSRWGYKLIMTKPSNRATVQPATEQPATEQPATEQPATEQPATEQPATEQPATEEARPDRT